MTIFCTYRCPPSSARFPPGVCAKLWDEDDCTGWEVQVLKIGLVYELQEWPLSEHLYLPTYLQSPEGYHEFSFLKSDDAEAVAVAPGCVLTVYDEDADDVSDRGDSRTFDNSQGNGLLVAEIDGDLDEDVEAYDCRCGCTSVRYTLRGGLKSYCINILAVVVPVVTVVLRGLGMANTRSPLISFQQIPPGRGLHRL